jgi:hypothetical protein
MSTHVDYRLADVVVVGDAHAEVTVSAFECDARGALPVGGWSDSVVVRCEAQHEHGVACGKAVLGAAAVQLDALLTAWVAARAPRRRVPITDAEAALERRAAPRVGGPE